MNQRNPVAPTFERLDGEPRTREAMARSYIRQFVPTENMFYLALLPKETVRDNDSRVVVWRLAGWAVISDTIDERNTVVGMIAVDNPYALNVVSKNNPPTQRLWTVPPGPGCYAHADDLDEMRARLEKWPDAK